MNLKKFDILELYGIFCIFYASLEMEIRIKNEICLIYMYNIPSFF